MAIVLVFTVPLVEFRTFTGPVSIVFGAILAMFGIFMALYVSGTSLNVVSLLGAIIGVGIVAKNGILMLDFTGHLRSSGIDTDNALVRAGRRRLRPVLMTSETTALGMLPQTTSRNWDFELKNGSGFCFQGFIAGGAFRTYDLSDLCVGVCVADNR